MSCFLSNSSLGKKLVMSVTGVFLVLFILFHMSMNITAIISPEAYNTICAQTGTRWPERPFWRWASSSTSSTPSSSR